MITRISTYKISVLKDDIKWKDDERFALLVETSDIETAQTLQPIIEAVIAHDVSEFNISGRHRPS